MKTPNKTIQFFSGSSSGGKVIDEFNAIAEEIINPQMVQIAENEFDITCYRNIEQSLQKFKKVQILTGVDTRLISALYGHKFNITGGKQTEPHAKAIYGDIIVQNVADVEYSEYSDTLIRSFMDAVKDGKIEFKIHTFTELLTNLHLFTYQPENQHYPSRKGIIGSGKVTTGRVDDRSKFWTSTVVDDVPNTMLMKEEFESLWRGGIAISPADIEGYYKRTHLAQTPSAHDLYMRVLIDYFDNQINNSSAFKLPDNYLELKYQTDAALQGFDMLLKHNGFLLADVVGLGKTNTAALTSQLFVRANGPQSKILVIYPPNGEFIWRSTFDHFCLTYITQFASFEFLDKVLNDPSHLDKEEYDLIIIDEAHVARNEKTILYNNLECFCKAPRRNIGGVKGLQKKIILVSATLGNNTPKDIYNPIRLFQNVYNSTIQGVGNLQKYFAPKIKEYNEIMRERKMMETSEGHNSIVQRIMKLYEPIRREVLDQITIRRTRSNLLNNPVYKEDLDRAGINFPIVEPPRNIQYVLDKKCQNLFEETVKTIIERLYYARYKAIERVLPEFADRYPKSKKISVALGNLYRNILVKRLESSFTAFKNTLNHLCYNTELMIQMFEEDKVIIAPDMKIKKLVEMGWSFDEIIDAGMDRYQTDKEDFVYPASDFDPEFIKELREDAELLRWLIAAWDSIEGDPKFDKFMESIPMFLDPQENPTGKLLIFTESTDTARYLTERLKKSLGREDILMVAGSDYKRLQKTIHENFDANWEVRKSDYNIIVATNCIAETINLHRANVIVNYDTPWNPIILMQRIGRLNRIGSVAKSIINYLFYPSAQGDATINLYKNAVIKLQGFHAAFGEDSQIFSNEEIVQRFELFNPTIGQDEDKRGVLLIEVREFHKQHPEEYERIKNLPLKSRAFRSGDIAPQKGIEVNSSIMYIDSAYKSGYFYSDSNGVKELTFLEATDLFRASKDEQRVEMDFMRKEERDRPPHDHYSQVQQGFKKYKNEVSAFMNNSLGGYNEIDQKSALAIKFIRSIDRVTKNEHIKNQITTLSQYILEGVYSQLPMEINRLKRNYDLGVDIDLLDKEIEKLFNKYYFEPNEDEEQEESEAYGVPHIIVSETFVNPL